MNLIIPAHLDLGLSAKYLDENGRHVRAGGETGGAGTPRYMSAYAHGHGTQSRRDDLESIGFLLMSFLRGNLPWDALPIGEYFRPPAESKVVQMKKNLDFDVSQLDGFLLSTIFSFR